MNALRNQVASRASTVYVRLPLSRLPMNPWHSLHSRRPVNAIRSRSLWWWSRRNDWTKDEDMEQRFQRHQKLMRNQYSKLLRRRSIWEGDEYVSSPVWARSRRWLVTRWADKKALSYRRALQSQMQEPDKRSDHERPWKEWDRDFDKLKARIDEAVGRDPYGTLFGRHLRGPPSPNNSSWTSFSWIYGPLRSIPNVTSKAIAEDGSQSTGANAESTTQTSRRTVFSTIPTAPGPTETKQTTRTEEEYEFDPVTMRKVPKKRRISPETLSAASGPPKAEQPKAPFLERLFSEHGIDIPVKTYKPHKVYGHGGSETTTTAAVKSNANVAAKPSGIGLESSRLRDLQALKFRTLGTNIDTTAEFGGKYKVVSDPDPIHLTSAKEVTTTPSPEESRKTHDVNDVVDKDTAAPFSGTTYEARATTLASPSKPQPSFKTSWLMKEGFQTLPEALSKGHKDSNDLVVLSKAITQTSSSRIEPALDRVKASDVKIRSKREKTVEGIQTVSSDRAEDLDLLRASDVRARIRSARLTKQEIAERKQQVREKLEKDYSSHQVEDTARVLESGDTATNRASKSLSNVWHHVKQYPQGIVAKTIRHMGIFNDNYKIYVRTDKPAQDSTEKLIFKDESLSKTPSIYKKVGKMSATPLQTFTPSLEVIEVEKAEQARLAFVRQINDESKKKALAESKQVEGLAAEIRNAYEQEYGKIDINHRQPAPESRSIDQALSPSIPRETALSAFKKPTAALQPMGPATVKPGVTEDPVIENHIKTFEPKLAGIMDRAKSARRAIHEAKLELMAIKSNRPQTLWNEERDPITKPQELMASQKREAIHLNATATSQPKSETCRIEPALDRGAEKRYPADPVTVPREHQEPTKYTSEYIILAYDPLSKIVTTSPLESAIPSAQDSAQKTGVPQILASLNHTAKFLSHFASLSNQGYEVVSGGDDVLVFRKRAAKAVQSATSPLFTQAKNVINENKPAAQGTIAQATSKAAPVVKAATVLDSIPASEPTPGPAAPTAPPLGPPSFLRPKVKRQEDVFSASKASRVSSPPGASTAKKAPVENAEELPKVKKNGLWRRFKRGVRRVFLTAAAMGVGAYAIGAVVESLGAQQHPEKVIRSGRPGIYSTEASR